MARDSTIGSNPLEAVMPPARPKGRAGASERSAQKPVVAEMVTPEAPADAAQSPKAKKSASSKWRIPSQLRLHRIHITGGDTTAGHTRLSSARPGATGHFRLPSGEVISLVRDVVRIEEKTEETTRRTGALLGWATAGAFLAGPLGALAGSLYGGRVKRSAKLDIHLHDGRHILATTDTETAQEIMDEIG